MSRSVWLVCNDCQVMVWLGKATMVAPDRLDYIHPLGAAPEVEKRTLNRVIWKMFADHAGHTLRVITEQNPDYNSLDGYREIGGDEYGDVDFETYLTGWPGTAP